MNGKFNRQVAFQCPCSCKQVRRTSYGWITSKVPSTRGPASPGSYPRCRLLGVMSGDCEQRCLLQNPLRNATYFPASLRCRRWLGFHLAFPCPPRSAPKRIVPSPLRPIARVRQPPAKTRLPHPLSPARPQLSHDLSASRLIDSALTRSAPQLQTGQVMVLPALRFEQGRAALLPTAQVALDSLAALLQVQTAWQLEVQGHTDNQGDKALNRQLSQRRAEIV